MDTTLQRSRRLADAVLIIAATIGVATLQVRPLGESFVSGAELTIRDFAQRLGAQVIPNQDTVLIDIDEESLRQIGPWPWSRSQIASLVEGALSHGAAIVAIDIVLPDARDATGDQALSGLAMSRKLVLSQVFDYAIREQAVVSGDPGGAIVDSVLRYEREIPLATGVIANHSGFQLAPCVGNIGFVPDFDGKLRSIPLITEWQSKLYPSLGLAVLYCLNTPPAVELVSYHPSYRLRFNRLPQSWPAMSAIQVLNNDGRKNLGALFDKKIVIIGSSALGLTDRVATPLSSSISGFYVHAAVLAELRETSTDQYSKYFYLVFGAAVVIAVGILLTSRLSIATQSLSGAVILSSWMYALFLGANSSVDGHLTGPLLGSIFLGMTLIPLQWSRARHRVKAVTTLLSRYVPNPVLKEITSRDNFDPLKPREAEITVLVADMADFSELAKRESLEITADITRRFLYAATTPVWAAHGTLDCYTGDGLIAFWGAPIETEESSAVAINAAQEMLYGIKDLNNTLAQEGFNPVGIRIGIASGVALVGDFGTSFRATYTAVGTCVNTASRLQVLAKELGVEVLVSESVAKASVNLSLVDAGSHEIRGVGLLRLFSLNTSKKTLS